MRALAAIACVLITAFAQAGDNADERRAKYNYQIHCQGCHAPDGAGAGDIPEMKGHVGYFLGTQAGREYLVRVPGSATSALGDSDLADVLNWIIMEFSGGSVGDNFKPYSQAEVGRLRQHPLNEVEQYRADLLDQLSVLSQERMQ